VGVLKDDPVVPRAGEGVRIRNRRSLVKSLFPTRTDEMVARLAGFGSKAAGDGSGWPALGSRSASGVSVAERVPDRRSDRPISKRRGGRSNGRKPEALRRAVLTIICQWHRDFDQW